MLKYLTLTSYIVIALLVVNCASGPSSVQFTSAKTKARSERNLKEAELYALEALVLDVHQQDAQVPYFLATEVYKPQKKWAKVTEMFDEAMKRDPEAMLLQPLMFDGEVITKMQDQITNYYVNELWYILYNDAFKIYEKDASDPKIIELLELAMHVNANHVKTYILLATAYKENDELNLSRDMINKGLSINNIKENDKAQLCAVKAETFIKEKKYSDGISSYKQMYDYYQQANDEDGLMVAMIAILGLNLLQEDWLESIYWSEKIYENDFLIDEENKMDVFLNMGLAYNNVASSYFNLARKVFEEDEQPKSEWQEALNNFKISYKYFDVARDFFLDLEMMDYNNAVSMQEQIEKYMETIDDELIPQCEKQLKSLNSN